MKTNKTVEKMKVILNLLILLLAKFFLRNKKLNGTKNKDRLVSNLITKTIRF